MPGKIQLLSEQTINQIAAGEVIENPASVVKELVDNAIDAGSKKIIIEIAGGGLQLIRISDIGHGMGEEDAKRCFERFATSKIRALDDLFHLSTMGFRGEALAAIAAISKVSLRTSVQGGAGTLVEIEGGKIIQCGRSAHTQGTTIEVRSLFYNVPARKKFQKSPVACAAEVTRMVSFLALAHPHVAFELLHQDRLVLSSQPSIHEEHLDRIQDVLGEDFLAGGLVVHVDDHDLKVKGLIGQPMQHRPNRTGQYLFINERPVHCPLISYAVKDGYGTRLASDRYPIFFLHLQIPADALDVNVHPQKKEVRIHQERRIKELVQQAISMSLQKSEGVAPIFQETLFRAQECSQAHSLEQAPFEAPFNFSIPSYSLTATPTNTFRYEEIPKRAAELDFSIQQPHPIGVFDQYLLLDNLSVSERVQIAGLEEGLLLIDLSAARSRVLFDRLLTQTSTVQSQALLLPLTISLGKVDGVKLEGHLEELEKMGLAIRPIGGGAFIVDALPTFLAQDRVKDLLLSFLEELSRLSPKSDEKTRKLALLAVRVANTEKKQFSQYEALALFEELMKSSSPYFCPNGKPTMIRMTLDEIAKLFIAKKTS